jgi:hypothetical protein
VLQFIVGTYSESNLKALVSSKELSAPSVKSTWCDQIAIAFIAFLFMLLLILVIFVVIFIAEALDVSVSRYMPIRFV